MKVLLLFPMYNGQTGPAIKHAFEQLGHEVVAVDAKRAPEKSYETSLQFKPILVFCSRTKALTNQVLQIKNKFPSTVTCMWNVDARETIEEWAPLFPLIRAVDYHFVVGAKHLAEFRKSLNANTFRLSQGLQGEIYKKPYIITDEDRKKYTCEVCFCGSEQSRRYHFERPGIYKAIKKAGFKFNLWGSYGNPQVWDEEHNKQVALAKINLGISGGMLFSTKAVSVRDYKIMGAGGFLLERCGNGLDEVFPLNGPDRILDCYNSEEELIEKIRYWLANEEERKAIAERAYEWVHKNATYTDRIRDALNYMEV